MTMLRKKREESGVTQEAIAAALGITQSQLSKWERRDRRVDLLEILRYCQALNITLASVIAEWEPTVAPLAQPQASGKKN